MNARAYALAFVHFVLARIEVQIAQSPGSTPFWMEAGISSETILYVTALVTLASLIAGAVPALRATSGLMEQGLRALGNRMSVRLGATWTALVVAQIALAVAILPSATELTWGFARAGMLEPGFPTSEFSAAQLELGDTTAGGVENASGFGELQAELARRLRREGVSAVTFSSAIAGAEPVFEVDVEETTAALPVREGRFNAYFDVGVNRIGGAFFDAFDLRILVGRRFAAGDFAGDSDAVIVNSTFARKILGEVNPLGRRLRYVDRRSQLERWYEVVGVSTNVPANDERARIYHPLRAGELNPVTLTLRSRSDRSGMGDSLRALATRVDPRLGVAEFAPLDDTYAERRAEDASVARALIIVTTSVLLLSAAGMYALMSFTVNQRRREIGIRVALGAPPARLLASVFRRALGQVSIGALTGLVLASLVGHFLPMDQFGGRDIPGIVAVAAVFMVLVGCLAASSPARRTLRAEPTENLREDG
jgi:putative ABC transport system permease protein